ncbi:MAG: hypothetical protein NXI32_05520 [bacterium]|nr:hypothetical protein [bacterium]
MRSVLQNHVASFEHLPRLSARLSLVLRALPEEIVEDFVADSTFQITLENYRPGKGSQLFMSLPTHREHVSRCVVLRSKLDQAPEDFALYIIAHELAHAFLRNGGWKDIEDAEHAADALALSWGFPKPKLRWF